MGSVSDLTERLRRGCSPAIVVGAHGFAVGTTFVAWQAVSEIRGWKRRDAMLEFSAGGACVAVSERQAGFDALDAAMIAVFPETADWRRSVHQARTALYRRG